MIQNQNGIYQINSEQFYLLKAEGLKLDDRSFSLKGRRAIINFNDNHIYTAGGWNKVGFTSFNEQEFKNKFGL